MNGIINAFAFCIKNRPTRSFVSSCWQKILSWRNKNEVRPDPVNPDPDKNEVRPNPVDPDPDKNEVRPNPVDPDLEDGKSKQPVEMETVDRNKKLEVFKTM